METRKGFQLITHLGEATVIEESLKKLDGERGVAIVDVTDINWILDSCFFVD